MAGNIVRVGFACVTYELGLTTNHGFRLAALSVPRLSEAVMLNLDHLDAILHWMEPTGLRMFRIGSSIVPFASHDNMDINWKSICATRLEQLGAKYSALGFRFSMHPGQYNVLNSLSAEVLRKTIRELVYSCEILDLMDLDHSHKVIVHGGGTYGDKAGSLKRLEEVIRSLPGFVRRRLVIENDDRHFSFEDIGRISQTTGIPAVFDYHHYRLKPSEDIGKLLDQAHRVWDCTPEIHISSQKPDARPGAHDLTIQEQDLFDLLNILPFPADLMVEAKGKEMAALRVLDSLKKIGTLNETPD